MTKRTGEGNLALAALCFIIAAALVFAAAERQNWPVLWRVFLGIAALILALLGVALTIQGLAQLKAVREIDKARIALKQAEATPKAVELRLTNDMIDRLSMASPIVLDILSHNPALARMIAGNYGPAAAVQTKDGTVPYSFLDEWLEVNYTADDLRPVREWPTAGNRQRFASWLERHLIAGGFLVTWDGSKTASWASPHARDEFVAQYYGRRVNRLRTQEAEG